MVSWGRLEAEVPELAAAVHGCFTVRKHCTLATLRKDGSPRISGIEVAFRDGELVIGSMPGAVKARDLQRDPRFALHSPTVDPPEERPADWSGEAKVSGRAIEQGTAVEPVEAPPGAHMFHLDLAEVVLTKVAADGEALEITTWHEGGGVSVVRRA